MSTAARQSKGPRKGPEPAPRRPPNAWGPGRGSPFAARASLPPNGAQPPAAGGPPAGQPNGTRNAEHERVLQQISGLTGTTITVSTKTNSRFEGVVLSTSGEGDTTGVTLKDVKEINNPGAPLRETFFIASTNIEQWTSGPADAKIPNGADTFKTDQDISHQPGGRRERELQAWQPAGDVAAPPAAGGRSVDEQTFGPGAAGTNGSWDQFAANEQLFGVTVGFEEEHYTTKLNRDAPDFKEKERKAQMLANEILGSGTSNPHVAEERVMNLTGEAANEEDKYGAVVRSANAYVPPGARRPGAPGNVSPTKPETPKPAVAAPDGVTPKGTSPAPSKDAVPAFREFVSTEKDRLIKKKQALMKSEMDKRLSDLVKFSQNFKLNKPIPEDLVPILAKDEDKQRAIKEKSTKDAEDSRARSIGVSATVASGPTPAARPVPSGAAAATSRQAAAQKATGGAATTKPTTVPAKAGEGPKRISMYIQQIPAFKGKRTTPTPSAQGAAAPPAAAKAPTTNNGGTSQLSPTAAARLNVNASSFRPTQKTSPFSPGGSPANGTPANGATASPKPKPAEVATPPGPPNPFFGTRVNKKTPPVHIKDDFNPFKYHKVADATAITGIWPYNGKRYMQMFPQIPAPPQQQSPHMAPPGPPPPMPPPATYEEDPAQQAARGGYIYAYPPYGYPGQMVQQMMPGMGPPPPGYMPGPYMQPMPYHMHAQNAMYPGTPMGQMPPPGAYMQPPPGTYPPPPNGAGPRPSMPPTPIPSHAHPYYHQSPQMPHAMAYPVMMPPPGPGVPVPHPHPYDAQQQPPPGAMGGHA